MRKVENDSVDVLYVALDPVFVSRAAADLEVYPDSVEFTERERDADFAFRHIAMALHAGAQAGRATDQMYGESLSTALVVHLLREYGGISMGQQYGREGLSREKLKRSLEYIQEQLQTDLTVAAIARTVHMSSHHFARLFKKATGQSPYRYVFESRARKARELLASGRFAIAEVAQQTGFADQSHLTRSLKQVFGVTPKALLNKRRLV